MLNRNLSVPWWGNHIAWRGYNSLAASWPWKADHSLAIPVIFNLFSLNCTQRITFDLLTTISHWQLMFICYFIVIPSFHWPLVVFRVSAFKGPSPSSFDCFLSSLFLYYIGVCDCIWMQKNVHCSHGAKASQLMVSFVFDLIHDSACLCVIYSKTARKK